MKRALTTLLFFVSTFTLFGQLKLDTVAELSYELKEISGLTRCISGGLWALNDSGNKPELFLISETGNILKKVTIAKATNVDWEELARDDSGNIYIGDFGNNRNNRQDLRIYVVRERDLLASDEVIPQVIDFSYSDQSAFPPPKTDQNFDMEAMVHFGNKLWLFSKNRTEPFTGYTRIYTLPTEAGTYTAQKVDSIFLGKGPRELLQITGADISPDGKLLALLSYDKIYLLHDIPYLDVAGGRTVQLGLPELSQRESIVFNTDSTLFLADERSVLGGGFLYRARIAESRKENNVVRKNEVTLPVKKFADTLVVQVNTEVRGSIYYEFIGGEGQRVSFGKIGEYDRGNHEIKLAPKPFMNGTYLLNIQVGNRPHAFFVYRFTGVDWQKVEAEFEERKEEVKKANEPE